MLYNTYQFEVTHHRRALPGLRAPVRITQLTDLHFGPFLREGSLRSWAEAAMATKPDVIVITGDFVDQIQVGSLEPLVDGLAGLHAPLGVWGSWGNHDLDRYRHDLGILADALERAGVRMLRNDSARLRADLHMVGVDDWLSGTPDMNRSLQNVDSGAAKILLNHNPDLLPDLTAGAVSLALCGHTHGGQVRFPVVGAPMTASVYGRRFLEGWVDAPVPAYVSRGLGTSLLPIRLLCPPEIAVFDLRPAQGWRVEVCRMVSSTLSGWRAATRSSARAGPLGLRLPCSQPSIVRSLTPTTEANWLRVMRSKPLTLRASGFSRLMFSSV